MPDSLTISGRPSVFNVEGTADMSIALLDRNGQFVQLDISPTWASSDPAVAMVSSSGTVVGMKPGVAIITATVGSVHGYATVTVVPTADTGLTIAAHRGFKSVFPENTLVAITGAFEHGADAVEVDVQLTVDGVPVLMHDLTVNRTTNGTGAVQFITLAQIEQLDACSKFTPTWAPCHVPTLDDALEAARGHGLLILDMKGPYTKRALVSLIDMVHSAGMSRSVIFASPNYELLGQLRQIDNTIQLGLFDWGIPLIEDIIQLGRAVGMPEEHALLADPEASSFLLRAASSQEVDLMAWTTSNAEEAKALVALGFRRIMSDVPLDKNLLR